MVIVTDPQKGIEKLKTGDFNAMHASKGPNGVEEITLSSEHYPETYRFRVRNLYQKDEEVFDADTGQFIPTRDLH